MIHVKYFAGLREQLGRAEEHISAEGVATVADVWARANGDRPMPSNILMAVNMEYSSSHSAVKDGDEIGFFPPVTGGM